MKRVLISGAGIAGPTLAYWLGRYSWTPTVVEHAPRLRTGGYVIDFWGAGYDVATRMGLLQDIQHSGYAVESIRIVDRRGHVIVSVPAEVFTRAAGSGFVSLPRSELAATLYRAIEGDVEILFGDHVTKIVEHSNAVEVTFARQEPRVFDLVIGADGLHSRIRALAFGPEDHFERYLGLKVAAFAADGYQPRDELVYVTHGEVGQQVARFTMRDDRTMFLFTFADVDPEVPATLADQKAMLRQRFGASGWECPQILGALDAVSDLYFDRVSQVELKGGWSRGRVALVGDAACCVSLLGGQGAALAMAAAYILAGELHRARGDHVAAFTRYEARFAPLVATKQRAARRFAGAFAPTSEFTMFLRNQLFKLFSVPTVAALATGRAFRDSLELPVY